MGENPLTTPPALRYLCKDKDNVPQELRDAFKAEFKTDVEKHEKLYMDMWKARTEKRDMEMTMEEKRDMEMEMEARREARRQARIARLMPSLDSENESQLNQKSSGFNSMAEDPDPELYKSNENESPTIYYSVMWGKETTKKHKTWENDGVLVLDGKNLTLKCDSKQIAYTSSAKLPDQIEQGTVIKMGEKVVQIQEEIQKVDAFMHLKLPVDRLDSENESQLNQKSSGFNSMAEDPDPELYESNENESPTIYYSVMWGKETTKKHKTWENDGVLVLDGKNLTLKCDSKQIAYTSSAKLPDQIEQGTVIKMGEKVVQIQEEIQKVDAFMHL